MIQKQLFVASPIQIALLEEIIIPEMINGYWKDHRPAGHGNEWTGVDLQVTTNGQVGPFNFKVPRLYNFTNPEFMEKCEESLIALAQTYDKSLTRKGVIKLLNELSQIVGGRLTDLSEPPVKAYRGNNVPDTRAPGSVLESGKGVGAEPWLSCSNKLIAAAKTVGAEFTTDRTHFTLERGAKQYRVFMNGAGAFSVDNFAGDVIHSITEPEKIDEVITLVITALTSVNALKDPVRRERNGQSGVRMNGDTAVRRVPVVRPKIVAPTFSAANPFGDISSVVQ